MTGITYDFPLTERKRVAAFARRHGLQYMTLRLPNQEPVVRVWFGDRNDLARKARDRYHALWGGHYAMRR